MHVTRLAGLNFRSFPWIDWQPSPHINLLMGANGAGKTSILEALYLFAYGRSFRSARRKDLVQEAFDRFELAITLNKNTAQSNQTSAEQRHGLLGDRDTLQAYSGLDRRSCKVNEVIKQCPVLFFGPDSDNLVQSSSDTRRRFIDWLVFHVEPNGAQQLQQQRRLLSQRNAALKAQVDAASLRTWSEALAERMHEVNLVRTRVLTQLMPHFQQHASYFDDELSEPKLSYWPGYASAHQHPSDALAEAMSRDRKHGFSSVGAHRADVKITFNQKNKRRKLSRGQAKSATLALIFSAASMLSERLSQTPLILLDDFGAELDDAHQHLLLDLLIESRWQTIMTATEAPESLKQKNVSMFHVERGENVSSLTESDETESE